MVYNALMNILKKSLVGLFAGLLSTTLFVLAITQVGSATIRNKEAVKGWFTSSRFYDRVFDVALEQINSKKDENKGNTSNGDGGFGSIPTDDADIQATAKQAFNAAFLQKNVEGVVDSIYNWLDGKTNDLSFKIDLTESKQTLANGFGSYVSKRAATLPVCQAGALQGDFDGFTSPCRPRALSASQAGSEFTQKLMTGDFLKDPIISSDSIKLKSKDGVEVPLGRQEQATMFRSAYQRTEQLPIALAVAALLLIAGIVFLSATRLGGVRKIGVILTINGVLFAIVYFGLGFVYNKGKEQALTSTSSTAKQTNLMLDFVGAILHDVKAVFLNFAVAYIVLAVACFVAIRIYKKRNKSEEKADTVNLENSTPAGEKPVEKPKSTKKLVQ